MLEAAPVLQYADTAPVEEEFSMQQAKRPELRLSSAIMGGMAAATRSQRAGRRSIHAHADEEDDKRLRRICAVKRPGKIVAICPPSRQAFQCPCSSRYFSTSRAAMQPVPGGGDGLAIAPVLHIAAGIDAGNVNAVCVVKTLFWVRM